MREILRARKLFRDHCGVIRKFPLNLLKLCKKMDYAVRVTPLDDFDGCHFRIGAAGRVLILLSSRSGHHRRRFTLAHEIGHIALGHMPFFFDGESIIEARQQWQETQANRFAAELLMPACELRRFGILTPQEIAQLCDVSLGAATIRARQLGWLRDDQVADL